MPDFFSIDALADAIAKRIAMPVQQRQRLLSLAEAGEYLGRTERSVRHLIADGVLPVVKLDAKPYLDIEDLKRIIEERKETK